VLVNNNLLPLALQTSNRKFTAEASFKLNFIGCRTTRPQREGTILVADRSIHRADIKLGQGVNPPNWVGQAGSAVSAEVSVVNRNFLSQVRVLSESSGVLSETRSAKLDPPIWLRQSSHSQSGLVVIDVRGKNVESSPLPPPTDGGGTAWRRRPRDAAASTIHVHTPRTRQPPLVLSPRSPCTIDPLCLPRGTHFDGGSAAASQNTMPLTRLPGCTKCRSDDSDALLGRRSRVT